MPSPEKRFQILSLSGGGVRGIYTITVLAALEQYLADRHDDEDYSIAQHFDLIAGTSIGGVLAVGLASGKLNARQLKALLDDNRKIIFPCSDKENRIMRKVVSALHLFKKIIRPVYNPAPLKKILEDKLGEIKLKEFKHRLLVPVVNATTGRPSMFKTPHSLNIDADGTLLAVDVCLATSAAPTYFPAHEVPTNDPSLFVDGGLIANSPCFCSYHEATNKRFLGQHVNDLHILQVGTMGTQFSLGPGASRNHGYLFGWGLGKNLIELTLGANEAWHEFMANHHLKAGHYVTLDEEQAPRVELDDSRDSTAKILKSYGYNRYRVAKGDAHVMAFFNHIAPSWVNPNL